MGALYSGAMNLPAVHARYQYSRIRALELHERAKEIRLFIVDIDGVMTDGLLYFNAEGDSMKTFFARDGLGLRLLMDHGIEVGIITGRTSPIVSVRAQDLKIQHVYQGRLNKLEAFKELLEKLELTPPQVAYMGDDIIDVPLLAQVGLAATVQDAHPCVLPYCHFVSQFPGGRGAVRECCDLILEAKGLMPGITEDLLYGGKLFSKAQQSC